MDFESFAQIMTESQKKGIGPKCRCLKFTLLTKIPLDNEQHCGDNSSYSNVEV